MEPAEGSEGIGWRSIYTIATPTLPIKGPQDLSFCCFIDFPGGKKKKVMLFPESLDSQCFSDFFFSSLFNTLLLSRTLFLISLSSYFFLRECPTVNKELCPPLVM